MKEAAFPMTVWIEISDVETASRGIDHRNHRIHHTGAEKPIITSPITAWEKDVETQHPGVNHRKEDTVSITVRIEISDVETASRDIDHRNHRIHHTGAERPIITNPITAWQKDVETQHLCVNHRNEATIAMTVWIEISGVETANRGIDHQGQRVQGPSRDMIVIGPARNITVIVLAMTGSMNGGTGVLTGNRGQHHRYEGQ
jgi:hypothetical protein